MSKNSAYIRAVDNMERLIQEVVKTLELSEMDISTLRYNVFLLKMMPSYTGLEPPPKAASERR